LIKILTDEEEEYPVLAYQECADSIVKVIKGYTQNFCIGIYGEYLLKII